MAARATSSPRSWRAAAAAIAALALLVATASAQTLQTTCYHKTNNVEHVTSPGGGPCGIVSPDTGFLSCCAVGDQCVEGGLCHFTHPPDPDWSQSGYYLGGCTDSSLSDPHCNTACSNLNNLDITFNAKTKAWLCCGATPDGNVTCNNPTTETVAAKPMASLATTYVVPSAVLTGSATGTPSSSSSSASSSGSSSASGSSSSSSSASSSSAGETTTTPSTGGALQSNTATNAPDSQKASAGSTSHAGAIAGGVVGGVAFIALVAAGGWFWYRRRANSSANLAPAPRYELGPQDYYAPLGKEPARYGRAELSTAAPATEMDVRRPMSDTSGATELP